MQESSLSCLLFNIYINNFLLRLSKENKNISKLVPNNLAFADDVAILLQNKDDINNILSICLKWATKYQLLFNIGPKKSAILHLGKEMKRLEFSKSELDLPMINKYKYLGIPFTRKGIAYETYMQSLSLKLKSVRGMLISLDFSRWAIYNRLLAFKAFCRSVTEYCIGLVPKEYLGSLQHAYEMTLQVVARQKITNKAQVGYI